MTGGGAFGGESPPQRRLAPEDRFGLRRVFGPGAVVQDEGGQQAQRDEAKP